MNIAGATHLVLFLFGVMLIFLVVLGAHAGGAGMVKGALRVLFWGALAMIVTAAVGRLFGTTSRNGPYQRRIP